MLIFQVKVGNPPPFYDACIASVKRYCERFGIAHEVLTEPNLRIVPKNNKRSANALRLGYLPIMEKANAFEWLREHEQVAIIDADVFIRDSAPNIFEHIHCDFAGVLERDLPVTDKHLDKLRKYSQGQYGELTDVHWDWTDRGAAFYNMGVMLLNRPIIRYMESPRELIERPEHERFVNGEGHWRWSTDQTLLNYWVKKSGMMTENLDWRWNALYDAMPNDRIRDAYFVHFFLAAKMPEGGAEIPRIIKTL